LKKEPAKSGSYDGCSGSQQRWSSRWREALLHCPKALIRSALWDASRHVDRAILPTYAQMLLDHVKGLSQEENDRQTKVMAERGLY
jgi:hypothetical protein